ncbi:MAG: YczE/YyaS/YitT family protein [Bacillota bacterium]
MKLFYRILFFLIGLLSLSFGISLAIVSGLGSGAWDALNVGLSETIGFTPGTWVILVGIFLIILNAFLLQTRPDIGAVITLFITGVFIDFWLLQIFDDLVLNEFLSKMIILLAGLLAMGIGISIYMQAKFPLSPIDNLMLALRKRFGFSFMVAKTVGEITALILAFIFGGPIGIGTLLVTFAVGPLIQLFSPRFDGLFSRLTAVQR